MVNGPPVVSFSPRFDNPSFDLSLTNCQEGKHCTWADWEPFLTNPNPIVLMDSSFLWPSGLPIKNVTMPSLAWKTNATLFAQFATSLKYKPYSCLYIRHSDYVADPANSYLRAQQQHDARMDGFRQILDQLDADAIHDRVYVASNAPSAPVCHNLTTYNVVQECLSTTDVDPTAGEDDPELYLFHNITEFVPSTAMAILDMFVCSSATERSHCFMSNERAGGTFWRAIVDFAADKHKKKPPKCITIDERTNNFNNNTAP